MSSSHQSEHPQTVLAIGAHPDDLEYGVGGSIIRHVEAGHRVVFLIMTMGECGGASGNIRKREAEEAARTLGVESVHFAGCRDTRVGADVEVIHRIEKVIGKVCPFRIYIPFLRDPHQDHRNTALAAISASRNIKQVLSYELPLGVSDFSPKYYIPMEDEILQGKIRALKCFPSQIEKGCLKQSAIEGLAKFRGFQVRTNLAEAFEIVRFVGF